MIMQKAYVICIWYGRDLCLYVFLGSYMDLTVHIYYAVFEFL